MKDFQINLYDEHEAIQEDLAREIIQKKKITWETFEPASFPCFLCKKNKAEVEARRGAITVHLCPICAALPDIVLMERIFGG